MQAGIKLGSIFETLSATVLYCDQELGVSSLRFRNGAGGWCLFNRHGVGGSETQDDE